MSRLIFFCRGAGRGEAGDLGGDVHGAEFPFCFRIHMNAYSETPVDCTSKCFVTGNMYQYHMFFAAWVPCGADSEF